MKPRLLYVDDDKNAQGRFARPLETKFGWIVDFVTSVEAALAKLLESYLQGNEYAGVVIDRRMPDPKYNNEPRLSAGDDLLHEVVTRYPYLTAVMLTNNADVESATRSTRQGACAFLIKGINSTDDIDRALRKGIAIRRVDRIYDRVLSVEGSYESARAVVSELAQILRSQNRPKTKGYDGDLQINAVYIPVSGGGSPAMPLGEHEAKSTKWLDKDPARWEEILTLNRTILLSGAELKDQWTASEFGVHTQVLIPVRVNQWSRPPIGDRIAGVVCVECGHSDHLDEEDVEIAERVARAIGLAFGGQRLREEAMAIAGDTEQRRLHAEFAHRVRNPLQTAKLTLENLLVKLNDNVLSPAESKERLTRLDQALRTAIDEALRFKDESVTVDFAPQSLDIRSLLEQIVANYPDDKRSILHLNVSRDAPLVIGDVRDLTYAFNCMIENSLEAILEAGVAGGHVEISLDPDPTGSRDVRISIVDNGCGLPQSNLERIFERGFTTKKGTGGIERGIGLWEVKRIVRKHNGDIEVSPAPKGGAYFSILLPAQTEPTRVSVHA